ncbi:dTDP-4-dehydrorhamnose reductase [Desulfovibrionales bacterium]
MPYINTTTLQPTGKPQKAIILGGRNGMLGQALIKILEKKKWTAVPQGRQDVDVLNPDALAAYLDVHEPDMVFNTIAYTQVDKAEDEANKAYALNMWLPELLGNIARTRQFRLVHYSTDFVFDGKNIIPYQVSNKPNPQCIYGKSKLAGENALLQAGVAGLIICRTAWLYGPDRKNFVTTVLNLAKTRKTLKVVHDQIGSPTYTIDLALYSYELVLTDSHGIFHLVNSGRASWYELAAKAVNLAGLTCQIKPIPSYAYPQKAQRPAYSVLSTKRFTDVTGLTPRPWPQALRQYISQNLRLPEYDKMTRPTANSHKD